ncbi:GerAB/ArcD/ProY family transporter [Paenibacillus cremeus]|uniref:GerAB/ArcD/ProY family transporter n=1 Tax=Paenibacillus cremeus TaxID=2163881 RepID=A0A559JFC7_9BACL|nr:endospore germination permease [Paenibacillus cremeus]TVX98567.1 GerAB/ArcD/ProY family transporter [Paenibacillus cremeus]
MINTERIAGRQFGLLVFFFIVGNSFLLEPSYLVPEAKQDAWISSLIGIVIGWLLVWLYNSLGSKFPVQTLTEYSEMILGHWLGKLAAMVLFICFFLIAAIVLRVLGDFVVIQLMPETPIDSILILFLAITVWGARAGIETIGRTAEILFPVFFILFISFFMLSAPNFEFKNMQPIVTGTGVNSILRGAIQFIHFPLMEMVALLMLFPYVNSKKSAKRAFHSGMLLGSFVLLTVTTLSILVLGAEAASKQLYPSFLIAKKINIAGFLQRIEVIMAIMWFISILFRLILYFYGSALSLAQILKLRDYRPLTFPLGLILYILCLTVSSNSIEIKNIMSLVGLPFKITYGFLIPLILLITAKLRKF